VSGEAPLAWTLLHRTCSAPGLRCSLDEGRPGRGSTGQSACEHDAKVGGFLDLGSDGHIGCRDHIGVEGDVDLILGDGSRGWMLGGL
jgi:hypothetical protein